MACDICGKTGARLNDLRDAYQTDDIKSICPECEKIVNKKHDELLDFALNMKRSLFQRFLCECNRLLQKQ